MLAVQSTIFCPEGRYRKMAVSHLLLPFQAMKQDLITAFDDRTYQALHEMAERRRYVPQKTAHYGPQECQELFGPAVRLSQVEHSIDALKQTGLVHWSPSELRFPTDPAAVPDLDVTAYTSMRAHVHPKRVWVPFPRRWLRYLVRYGSPGLIASAGYVIQRCFWDPTEGVCAGAVSPEALAACCDFSQRTAARHLATFERLGWLHWDPRPRQYERTYGRWYVINPTWKAPQHPTAPAPRPRRPRQLSLPLPAATGDRASAEASPPPAPAKAESVEAEPPAAARATPDDGCKNLSGCEGISCKNLSGCTRRNASNPANCRCSSPPIPFQEIFFKHQTPTPPADPSLITAGPTQPILPLSTLAPGVQRSKENPMQNHNPAKPPPSTETRDMREARYASLPADRQAALQADAEAHLLQQGYKRDFLTSQLILPEVYRLLAAQEGCAAPVAPAASANVAPPPPPAPARPTPTPALGPPTLDNVIPADVQVRENVRRALELGRQAQDRGWIRWRAPARLYVVAAALHAVRCGKDNPCGLYRWLLEHPDEGSPMVTPDEPEAQAILKAYDYGIDPQRRAPPPPTPREPSALAQLVDAIQRQWARLGYNGDAFAYGKTLDPELTRATWDRGVQAHALQRVGDLGRQEDGRASPSSEAVEPCPECGEEGEACLCPEAADIT